MRYGACAPPSGKSHRLGCDPTANGERTRLAAARVLFPRAAGNGYGVAADNATGSSRTKDHPECLVSQDDVWAQPWRRPLRGRLPRGLGALQVSCPHHESGNPLATIRRHSAGELRSRTAPDNSTLTTRHRRVATPLPGDKRAACAPGHLRARGSIPIHYPRNCAKILFASSKVSLLPMSYHVPWI
jgi:hypothetical protein